MLSEPFNAARWTETAETLGFRIHVVVKEDGMPELEVIAPRGLRDLGAETELWSDLRPSSSAARLNEATLCQYLKRTGRAVRSREGVTTGNIIVLGY